MRYNELIEASSRIGSRLGRIYALARKANATLSTQAMDAVEMWQHSNWATGKLARAYADQSALMTEIQTAFAPVRAALQQEFGDHITLYRGHKPDAMTDRQLYSWSLDPAKAGVFIGGKAVSILTDEQIDAAVAQYDRTGFVRVGRHKYLRMKSDPTYYMIYDRHNQPVTDGDDLRSQLQSDNADRQDYNKRIANQGQLLSANVPLQLIVWLPINALSLEVIVLGDPEELASR